jgi:hypothetical protein
MKVGLRGYGVAMSAQQRFNARSQAIDLTLTRGTRQIPQPPRDIIAQSGPRGILVTWNYPAVNQDIQRWRVYKGNESTLYIEIKDRGTRQCFMDATAGASPPVVNIFVSSVNSFGMESPKVQIQATPIAEAGAPTLPGAPPEYTAVNSGGADRITDYRSRRDF